ncbi:MAG TPA: glycerate kinase [Lachnospiraceae bacterium]|jgi:glycerate 2-kinase|nr:glycerate kinase [Lachnospiraceae bacterium]
MRILVAIDSLKGSLSSLEAGAAIKTGVMRVYQDAEVVIKPLADGGEGTVDALVSGMGGKIVTVNVTGPLGEKVDARYGMIESKKLAVMEMAAAAGIMLVAEQKRNPKNTTTFGVGEMILDAVQRGCRDFIIGIGGSATNDGGLGMLEAMGAVFYDENGDKLGPYGLDMLRVAKVDVSGMKEELKECNFRIACDVENPLCGPMGAAHVYGPQKGATPQIVEQMDAGLKNYATVIKKQLDRDCAEVPGSGAAGGLGYAFVTFLNGKLEPGISIILDTVDLESEIKEADYVITGEGKLDAQTAMGKAPAGVAKLALKYGKKAIAFCGAATEDAAACHDAGIDAYFPILRNPMTIEEAMEKETAVRNIELTAEQVFRLIKAVNQ